MLNAVLSGKAGRLNVEGGNSLSWKGTLKVNEDILTASVFERLAYLPGSIFWAILRESVIPHLPSYQIAKLKELQFWPTWDDETEGNSTVEPDVFLRFHVGDPRQTVDIIIEAKRHITGSVQYDKQWCRQCLAYLSKYADNKADHIFFLAVGGLGDHEESQLRRLSHMTVAKLPNSAIKFHGGNWGRLTNCCKEYPVTDIQIKYILSDIIAILEFSGYRNPVFFNTLRSDTMVSFDNKERCLGTYDFGENFGK